MVLLGYQIHLSVNSNLTRALRGKEGERERDVFKNIYFLYNLYCTVIDLSPPPHLMILNEWEL